MDVRLGFRVGVGVVAVVAVAQWLRRGWGRTRRLEEMVERKLREREERRAEFERYVEENAHKLPSEEKQREIASLTALQVVEKMKSGELSVESVMMTMCLRAYKCGKIYSSNTEEMFIQALERAKKADEQRTRDQTLPPLFGLPVSIKDHIDFKGTDSTSGIISRLHRPVEENGWIVDCLERDGGAICFVKTNVPQLLLLPESTNKIYGCTLNPWKPEERTPGGSSGGESALISSACSFLGMGTDIGGSVRIPAHFTGIAAFKPTPERISGLGRHGPQKGFKSGQQAILGVTGPMARCVQDLIAVMKLFWSENSLMYDADPLIPKVTYRDNVPQTKRVGMMCKDNWFDVAPACARAVEEAKIALEECGYHVISVNEELGRITNRAVDIFLAILGADGKMRHTRSAIDHYGEPLFETYRSIYIVSCIPRMLRPPVSFLLKCFGESRMARLVDVGGERTVLDYWNICIQVDDLRREFSELMKRENLDAIILPGGTLPAFPHGKSKDLLGSINLTFAFNVLHVPAGTVPMTVTRASETTYESAVADDFTRRCQDVLRGSEGLPVGVQVVAEKWQDEKCLQVMKDIQDQVQFHAKHERVLPYLR